MTNIGEKIPSVTAKNVLLYTGCNRRNVRDFRREFLRSNYTDITQNTYIQSWTVTEIMAIKMCGLLGCRRTVVSNIILVNCACPTRHVYAMTLASALQWVGELWSANMPFVFSHVEYCDMHFVYGFCDGNANAAVEEYRRRYPERRIPSRDVFTRVYQTFLTMVVFQA